MKTFFEFLAEELSFRERVQPAIRHTDEEGKVHIKRGKRGEDHAEIRERHMKEPGKPLPGDAGFYDPKDKKFYTRSEMGGYDSTRLLTPKEREERDERLEKKYAGGQSSTDNMTDFQRTRQMLRYTGKLDEGNPLVKVAKALENKGKRGKTSYIATISADRGGMNKSERREAHGRLQSSIRRHIEKGMLKMIGGPKQSGEYRYADPEPGEEGVAKEKSYVLAPGKHPKARGNFHRIMKKLGRDAGQESILKITQVGNNRPAGSLHYTTGPNTGKSEKSGRMYMNVDMPKSAGRTKFKNKDASVVVKKADKKDDGK